MKTSNRKPVTLIHEQRTNQSNQIRKILNKK